MIYARPQPFNHQSDVVVERFATAVAEWALSAEMPRPRATAQGSSGGMFWQLPDGHAEYVPEGREVADYLPRMRWVWWRGRVADLVNQRGYPREVRDRAWALLPEPPTNVTAG